ncbi:MAG: hypothetical protein R2796_10185 [Chitinophagaceae bacterium]
MKKKILILVTGSVLLFSCRKNNEMAAPLKPEAQCELQTANPAETNYAQDSLVAYQCTSKLCGFIPMSSNNYWVYEDSVFEDGSFKQVTTDTLRFTSLYMSYPDKIVWWKSSINVGLPEILYANQSAFFSLEESFFPNKTLIAKKDYSFFSGDSIRYLTSFNDAAAIGRSIKLTAPVVINSGSYTNCLFFEKNARGFRRDQVYFKPGIGVLKFRRDEAKMGQRIVMPKHILTLKDYHIE